MIRDDASDDTELHWRNQPEWIIRLEMERRLAAYFAHGGRERRAVAAAEALAAPVKDSR